MASSPGQTPPRTETTTDSPPPEVLSPSPEVDEQQLAGVKVTAASYTAPIPPPEMFRGYEDVLPGSADRILKMAEIEQQRRLEDERTALHARIRDVRRAHWISLATSLGFITGSVLVSVYGNPYVAGVLGGTGLVAGIATILRYLTKKDD